MNYIVYSKTNTFSSLLKKEKQPFFVCLFLLMGLSNHKRCISLYLPFHSADYYQHSELVNANSNLNIFVNKLKTKFDSFLGH